MVTFQFYRNIREIQEIRICIYSSLADTDQESVLCWNLPALEKF